MNPLWALRQFRLQTLMARQLRNWREVWNGHLGGERPAALRFRDGKVLWSDARGQPGFLFLEVFANQCYGRGVRGGGDGIVVDVGANVGAFTLYWAASHAAAQVHAYEPDPDVCEVLRQNVRENGLADRVTIFQEAVGGEDGRAVITKGATSLETSVTPTAASIVAGVPAVSLATVVERAGGTVVLLKLDVEGAEADIVEHARAALGSVDEIVGEYHEAAVPDVKARILRALSPTHRVSFDGSRRCGPMFHAVASRGARP